MWARFLVLGCIVACWSGHADAEDIHTLLSRFKQASGGTRWDEVRMLELAGTLRAGGLSGKFVVVYDAQTGRYVNEYSLGPVTAAQGFDGQVEWSRDPGGEVAALDAPDAVRRARTQSWLDARGYWYPDRFDTTYSQPVARAEHGKPYVAVVATPRGGDPVTLWFAADSFLLVRTVQRSGADTVTTLFDDYREADGLRLPFRMVADVTDAAGRTDPRRRTETYVERVTTDTRDAEIDFKIPEMTAAAHIEDAGAVTRIPFDLINNHIYVEGRIDGKPVRLLVDTGGVNVLTPAAAQRLGLSAEGQLAASGVGDERVDVALVNASEVRVGGALLSKPVFYIIDLGVLDSVEGISFDGLVGYEMFRRFSVQIDYASRMLTLAQPDKFAPPEGATVIPFELSERMPIVGGSVDGIKVRLSIDTGSRSALTMHSPFVRDRNLVARYRASEEGVIGWGVGGAVRGRAARLSVLQLGDLRIAGVIGEFFTGDKGSFATPDIDDNLGGGVLRRFTVAFDYAAKRMYLTPNAHFDEPDTFDRSGMWVNRSNDVLEVMDVAPGSAAQLAGLRTGDHIVAIDAAPVPSQPLSEWRRQLRERPVGTQLSIRFERDGKARDVVLTLADRVR